VPETLFNHKFLLSAIIPLTQMAGRMKNLDTWLSETKDCSVNFVIVHDIQDSFTSLELNDLLKKYRHLEIDLVEGFFGSPGLARNAGLKSPRGTWTAFWDADDLPNPTEALAAIAETDEFSEVIIGNFTVDSPNGTQLVKHHNRVGTVAVNPGLWRMLIRSSVLEEVRFGSTRMGEDQLFLIDLNLGSRKIHFCERNLYRYFQGDPMQLTSNQDSVNEVQGTLDAANERINNDKNLRNMFSEIVLLRLLATTLFRTKGTRKLRQVFHYAPIIFRTHLKTLIGLAVFILKNKKDGHAE
jgi:glycosyltransferase involved in cell wall biosynthesis